MFLMDSKMRVFYTGAIDSSTFDSSESTPFLQNAIQALVAGKEPAIAKTLPFGTILRRSAQDERASPFESLPRGASAFCR